jgi:luciferase family oxidoreductase group 1
MTLPLSILDLSTIQAGATPAEAIRLSVELAKVADGLGYRRYWLAEHHSTDSHAGTAPEILIAALTQATSRIRLGSGAVLLANYSPLKVVEQFMTLEALAPGRIDLGIGRAIGADELTGQALRTAGLQSFPTFFSPGAAATRTSSCSALRRRAPPSPASWASAWSMPSSSPARAARPPSTPTAPPSAPHCSAASRTPPSPSPPSPPIRLTRPAASTPRAGPGWSARPRA